MKVIIDGIEYVPALPIAVGDKPLRVILREVRKALGLTIVEAAAMVGVSTSAIVNLESGVHNPLFHTMARLSQVYGVPIQILVAAALNEEE